jgi:hypothetical protein
MKHVNISSCIMGLEMTAYNTNEYQEVKCGRRVRLTSSLSSVSLDYKT